MKIVYCILGTYNSGGMERVLANKTNYLVNQGHEIFIITSDQKNRSPYFKLDNRIHQIDLAINYTDHVGKGLVSRSLTFLSKQRQHKKKLKEQLTSIKADVCVSMFDYEVSFLPQIDDSSKKVLEIHFSRFKRIQYGRKGILGVIDKLLSKRDKKLASKYDKFVVLTHEDKSYWGEMENIGVIPNANSFEPLQSADLFQKRAIAVGRYDYQKGFEDLIDIWKLIEDKVSGWRLDIYGHGPLKDDLQQQIDRLNLNESVFLRNPVKEIEKEYLNSAVVLMTSKYEGLPMALLEGQVCGLPMISYTCKCGPKDIISPGVNGFLAAEGDKESFSQYLLKVLKNDSLRISLGMNAKENSKNFQQDVIMNQWNTLFKSLLGK